MAAHDQLKAISATVSAAGIELAALERLLRKCMAPTGLDLDEVAYWPMPVRAMVDLATSNDVAIDYATAQRMLNTFWNGRARTHGADLAMFNLEPGELVRYAAGDRLALNTTWQTALVTAELNTGLVAMLDLTARPDYSTGNDKRVVAHMWLTTPEGVELYRKYGEIDRRDGAVDLLCHEATEANWTQKFHEEHTPLRVAAELVRMLANPPKAEIPAGLSVANIKDCAFDLGETQSRLDAVLGGRHPAEVRVESLVTGWRQTT